MSKVISARALAFSAARSCPSSACRMIALRFVARLVGLDLANRADGDAPQRRVSAAGAIDRHERFRAGGADADAKPGQFPVPVHVLPPGRP